jgi:hypothetical protein
VDESHGDQPNLYIAKNSHIRIYVQVKSAPKLVDDKERGRRLLVMRAKDFALAME